MRWYSIICVLIGLTSISGAPTGSQIDIESVHLESTSPDTTTAFAPSSSLSSARKLPTHDVGLPSELAWQAWLVVANKPDAPSSFESATVPRRISPKSVFVAPELRPDCSDGYRADVMGRCVKETIQINYKSHLEFILDRLRSKFPSTIQLDDSAATGPDLKQSAASGPLQVNISLGIKENLSASRSPFPSNMSERETSSDESVEISVVHVSPVDGLTLAHKPARETEAVLTAYEVGNGTNTGQEQEGTFFRGNLSKPFKDHPVREVVVPVAEIIDDGNQTIAEVIDYEIPLSLGTLFNTSHDKTSPVTRNITETRPRDDTQQPTVVLLLSPAKLTGASSTPYFEDLDSNLGTTSDHIAIGTGNLNVNSTAKDEVSSSGAEVNPSFDDIVTEENEEDVTLVDDEYDETTVPDLPETVGTTSYPEEDLDAGTESTDEILAHSEAGMLVSARKSGPSISPEESLGPSSTNMKTGEESGGNISSESSISGDVILETTLLDLNTGTTPTHLKLDEPREVFEVNKDLDLEPEVVFSPQDSHRLDRPSTRGKKRAEELTVSSSRPQLNQDDSSTLESSRRETTQHPSRHRGQIDSDRGLSPGEQSHLQQRRRTNSGQDYVRFPEDQTQRQSSSSYVLFPSDHSNSINGNPNSKERTRFVDEIPRPQLMPKSSVPLHQKKGYWHLPPGWRIEDLQPPRQPAVTVQNDNQRQNPLLFRFWTRMPLFRDPSLTTTTTSNQSSRSISPIVTQRDNVYRSVSPQGMNRVFGQTGRGTTGGRVIG